jgi:hypothetical protein
MLKAHKRKKKIKMDLCVCLEFLPGEPEKIVEFFVGEKKTAREVLELALTKDQLEGGYYLIEDNEGKTLEELSYDKDIVWVRLDRTRKKPNKSNDDGTFASTQLDYEDGYMKDATKEELKEDHILKQIEEKAKTPTMAQTSEHKQSLVERNFIEPIAEELRRNSSAMDYTDDDQFSYDEIRESISRPDDDLRRDGDPWSQRLHIFGIVATITGGGLTLARNDSYSAALFVVGLFFFTVTLFNNKTFSYLKNARHTEEGVSGYIQELRKVRPLLKWTVHSYHMATENTSKRHKRRIKRITHEATKFWIPKNFATGGDDLNKIVEIERTTKKSELLQLKLTKSFKFLDKRSERLYMDTLRRFRAHHNRDNKLAFKCELLIDGFEPLTLFHPMGATTSRRWVGLWSYFLASFCCLSIPYRIWFNRRARRIGYKMIKYIGEISDEDFTYVYSDDDNQSMGMDRSSSLLIPDYSQSQGDNQVKPSPAGTGSPVKSRGSKSRKELYKTGEDSKSAKKYEKSEDIWHELPMGICAEIRQQTRTRTSSVEIFLRHQKNLGRKRKSSYSIFHQKLQSAAVDIH